MKTSTYNSWWREMGAISRGMMFIEGTIAMPAALDRTQQDVRAALVSQPSPPRDAHPAKQSKKAFGLYEDLLFLGGRPMTAGHNDDIDEPFPQTYADEPQLQSRRLGGGRRQAPQSQSCATC